MEQPSEHRASWRPALAKKLLLVAAIVGVVVLACERTPVQPTGYSTPDSELAADAAAYWQDVLGLPIQLAADLGPRRILVRAGELPSPTRARAILEQVDDENGIVSVVIVIRPDLEPCRVRGAYCRALYRHELGHALGFFGHSDLGLMHPVDAAQELSDRERRMMVALYSLPVGASVFPDGRWSSASGQLGTLEPQVAIDVITWNVEAENYQSVRQANVTSRWVGDAVVSVMR